MRAGRVGRPAVITRVVLVNRVDIDAGNALVQSGAHVEGTGIRFRGVDLTLDGTQVGFAGTDTSAANVAISGGFDNITRIIGSSAGAVTDTLNFAANNRVGGAPLNGDVDLGTVNSTIQALGGTRTLTFVQIESLTTGAGNDDVDVNSDITIELATGAGQDTVDLVASVTLTAANVDLGDDNDYQRLMLDTGFKY